MTLEDTKAAVDAGDRVHELLRWKRIFGLKPVGWSGNVAQTIEV